MKCKRCGEEKEDWQFESYTVKSTGREYFHKICRVCRYKWAKERRKIFRYSAQIKYKFGITEIEFELMLKKQDNKCLICGLELVKPCIDHCHKAFKIRGILCRLCNSGLGMFKDNPELLEKAAKYLRERN